MQYYGLPEGLYALKHGDERIHVMPINRTNVLQPQILEEIAVNEHGFQRKFKTPYPLAHPLTKESADQFCKCRLESIVVSARDYPVQEL